MIQFSAISLKTLHFANYQKVSKKDVLVCEKKDIFFQIPVPRDVLFDFFGCQLSKIYFGGTFHLVPFYANFSCKIYQFSLCTLTFCDFCVCVILCISRNQVYTPRTNRSAASFFPLVIFSPFSNSLQTFECQPKLGINATLSPACILGANIKWNKVFPLFIPNAFMCAPEFRCLSPLKMEPAYLHFIL